MTEHQSSLSEPFIRRPVATTLLTVGVALAGIVAFTLLPVSPLPQVDIPTISVSASLPGGSPETMSTSVATPLERQLGRIAGVTEMTSSSSQGSTNVTLQFDLNRDIDGAARDVQAALNAARAQLPTGMPGNPTYRKVNPADQPILILAMTSNTLSQGQIYDAASTIVAQKIAQVQGVGAATVGCTRRIESAGVEQIRDRARHRAHRVAEHERESPEGFRRGRRPPLADLHERPGARGEPVPEPRDRLARRLARAPVRCCDG